MSSERVCLAPERETKRLSVFAYHHRHHHHHHHREFRKQMNTRGAREQSGVLRSVGKFFIEDKIFRIEFSPIEPHE